MTTVTPIASPAGASTNYQFFKDDTGKTWKAKIDFKVARQANVVSPVVELVEPVDPYTQIEPVKSIEFAPAEMAITVTVSPVDSQGKALREDDKPIVIDSHTHTFTSFEMASEEFNPEQRIVDIVAQCVGNGQARVEGQAKLNAFVDRWNQRAKLTTKGTHENATD